MNGNAICIGKFDCIHTGHNIILEQMFEYARIHNLTPTVIILFPSPERFFTKNYNIKSILSLRERKYEIQKFGKYNLYMQKFTKEFASMEKNNFIEDILIKKFNIKALFVGSDFRFGHNRSGTIEDLKEYSIDIHTYDILKYTDSQIISTSNIKNAIQNGNIITVNQMLGRQYSISGQVVYGKKLAGNILGFKTANIYLKSNKIMPRFGVYRTSVTIDNIEYQSITNVGIKPTFNNNLRPTMETHIFKFNDDLYGKILNVQFIEFFRDERKFDSINQLRDDISELIKVHY